MLFSDQVVWDCIIRFIPVDHSAFHATWHPVETKVEKNNIDSVYDDRFLFD